MKNPVSGDLPVLRRRLFGASALAALATLSAISAPPAESWKTTGEADIEYLELMVKADKAGKKGIPGRVKAASMVLAANAQEAKNYDLRDAALKVAEAASKKQVDGTAIAALKKPAASTNKKDVKLATMHKIDVADLMNLFGGATGNGMNMEKDIREWKKNGVKDTKAAEAAGIRSAIIAEFAMELPPQFNAKKKKEDWEKWNKDMKTAGHDLATEAAKGAKANADVMKKAATALDESCVKCHNVFRED